VNHGSLVNVKFVNYVNQSFLVLKILVHIFHSSQISRKLVNIGSQLTMLQSKFSHQNFPWYFRIINFRYHEN
jgi:hypothetical protein